MSWSSADKAILCPVVVSELNFHSFNFYFSWPPTSLFSFFLSSFSLLRFLVGSKRVGLVSHKSSTFTCFVCVGIYIFNTWIQLRLVVLSWVALSYQLKNRTIQYFVECRDSLFGPLVNKVVCARKSCAQDL